MRVLADKVWTKKHDNFVRAQEFTYFTALEEIRRGRKESMKLKSSMTLFALISEEDSVFHRVLDKFYDGAMDGRTLGLLREKQ